MAVEDAPTPAELRTAIWNHLTRCPAFVSDVDVRELGPFPETSDRPSTHRAELFLSYGRANIKGYAAALREALDHVREGLASGEVPRRCSPTSSHSKSDSTRSPSSPAPSRERLASIFTLVDDATLTIDLVRAMFDPSP